MNWRVAAASAGRFPGYATGRNARLANACRVPVRQEFRPERASEMGELFSSTPVGRWKACRRLRFVMLNRNLEAVSPAGIFRALQKANRLETFQNFSHGDQPGAPA